jgi:hypothetical protein
MRASRSHRGFSLIELFALLAVGAVVAVVILPALWPGRVRTNLRPMKDASQIRGIHQSMVQWANSNDGRFPRPSDFDKDGFTVDIGQRTDPRQALRLDSTSNIFSLLVWNGSVPTQLMVSPAEAGPIIFFEHYEVKNPDSAAVPAKALWDPSFRAHPADAALGKREVVGEAHFSYAHIPPFGKRADIWTDTADSRHAVLANRGPAYEPADQSPTADWRLLPASAQISPDFASPVGRASNTLLIHGSRNTWEGNVAYNDNRVIFETQPAPEDLVFTFSGLTGRAARQPDNLFANENDAKRTPDSDRLGFGGPSNDNRNMYLRSYGRSVSLGGTAERPSLDIVPFYD